MDACCTLNVLATQLELEIAVACDFVFIISDYAHAEVLFLDSPPDDKGVRTKEPASTLALRNARRLEVRALDTTALLDAFVDCAAHLRDEDASCVALAAVLGLPLMTDDGKEQRVARTLFPSIEILSTLSVLQDAATRLNLAEKDLMRVATALRWRGNFAPPRKDPLSPWYAELLRKAGVPNGG